MGVQTFLLILSISFLRFCGGTYGGSVGDHTTSPFCAIHQESPYDIRRAYPTSFWPTSFDDHAQLSTHVWDLEPPLYDDGGPDQSSPSNLVNVDDFGAVGDGLTDDTKAFGKAWKEACSSLAAQSVMMVPEDKNYLLKPIKFRGPCKSLVQVTIYIGMNQGSGAGFGSRILTAYKWKAVAQLMGMERYGGISRAKSTNHKSPCKGAPTALTFASCKGLAVKDLKIRNSQQIHLSFQKCQSVEAANLTIMAPERSPNTDGIHVTGTQNINIEDSVIGTGDDCISIVSGSKNIKATNIKCGPGHGISIGSLGKGNSEDSVSEVVVDGAKIVGTTNGVRIKTWQGGSGKARNIKFQNIEMENVTRPIIIDQYYCDSSKPCPEQKSAVEISNVVYKNIEGTSASKVAVEFDCSESIPCKEIVLEDINLVGAGGEDTESSCKNVQGTAQGKVYPSSCL
ncbi:hypothetical protein ACLOJK_021276 [Asimina triloba]